MKERVSYIVVLSGDVDPEQENRFNQWYDEEHIPSCLRSWELLLATGMLPYREV